jgi:hypothetical protein
MKNLNINKKGQTQGLVTGVVFGVAALVIAVIIAFVIISTLNNASLLSDNRQSTRVNYEYFSLNNTKNHSLFEVGENRLGYTIIAMMNSTTNTTVAAANYTISPLGVVYITDAGKAGLGTNIFVWANYSYLTKNSEELTATGLSTNLSSGVNNVSSKIPTVLLIAAIVLILGVLAVLVGVWLKMRMGGGSI